MSKPFQPLLTALAAPKPATPATFQAVACASSHLATQPTITVKRDGDQITHITVQCVCGHLIELTCQY